MMSIWAALAPIPRVRNIRKLPRGSGSTMLVCTFPRPQDLGSQQSFAQGPEAEPWEAKFEKVGAAQRRVCGGDLAGRD